jgi:hypothetical protein
MHDHLSQAYLWLILRVNVVKGYKRSKQFTLNIDGFILIQKGPNLLFLKNEHES